MSALLERYVRGSWFRAADGGIPLRDAVSGGEVARRSSTGPDLAAVADHARTVVLAGAPVATYDVLALIATQWPSQP